MVVVLALLIRLDPYSAWPIHPGFRALLKYSSVLFLVVLPFERIWGSRQRKLFTLVWWNDFAHLLKSIPVAVIIGGYLFVLPDAPLPFLSEARGSLASMINGSPRWGQFLLILFLTDLYYYGIHRFAHSSNALWKTHAVHHSIRKVDWIGGFRIHFIDHAIFRIGQAYLYVLFGFDPQMVGLAMLTVPLYSSMLHLNIDFRIRWLEQVVATPFFHHWHHDITTGNRVNYANVFPIIDRAFGTLYLPKDWPKQVGVEGNPVSEYLIPQMIYPFREWALGIAKRINPH